MEIKTPQKDIISVENTDEMVELSSKLINLVSSLEELKNKLSGTKDIFEATLLKFSESDDTLPN